MAKVRQAVVEAKQELQQSQSASEESNGRVNSDDGVGLSGLLSLVRKLPYHCCRPDMSVALVIFVPTIASFRTTWRNQTAVLCFAPAGAMAAPGARVSTCMA